MSHDPERLNSFSELAFHPCVNVFHSENLGMSGLKNENTLKTLKNFLAVHGKKIYWLPT